MVDGRCCFGNLSSRNIDRILVKMGLYGSIWVDIEGIRSHMGYEGSGMGDGDLVWHIMLKYLLMLVWNFFGKGRAKNSKNIHALEVAYGYQKA